MTNYDQMTDDQKFLSTIARNTNVLQFMVALFHRRRCPAVCHSSQGL
jgi:hypothetical protein